MATRKLFPIEDQKTSLSMFQRDPLPVYVARYEVDTGVGERKLTAYIPHSPEGLRRDRFCASLLVTLSQSRAIPVSSDG
eukprot:431594-Amorphochlora_amoeboformis.AAC.1